jgi:hypothetical protein
VDAFIGCSALTTANFPQATSIGNNAFSGCSALETANFPQVTSIGYGAFSDTGGTALTITLPQTAPAVSSVDTSSNSTDSKTVTISTPADRTGYDPAWEADFKKAFGNRATITLEYQ